MRMCDQSMELISDKYEKTVEDLQDEINLTHDKYKQKIEGMQDELAITRDNYEQTVNENKELKDEVVKMKGAMSNMESVINELRTTISRLEKQLQVQQEK